MAGEAVLADAVRAWSETVCPGDRRAADRAVDVALRCYAAGASVGEACAEARLFITTWATHPSHRRRGLKVA